MTDIELKLRDAAGELAGAPPEIAALCFSAKWSETRAAPTLHPFRSAGRRRLHGLAPCGGVACRRLVTLKTKLSSDLASRRNSASPLDICPTCVYVIRMWNI